MRMRVRRLIGQHFLMILPQCSIFLLPRVTYLLHTITSKYQNNHVLPSRHSNDTDLQPPCFKSFVQTGSSKAHGMLEISDIKTSNYGVTFLSYQYFFSSHNNKPTTTFRVHISWCKPKTNIHVHQLQKILSATVPYPRHYVIQLI